MECKTPNRRRKDNNDNIQKQQRYYTSSSNNMQFLSSLKDCVDPQEVKNDDDESSLKHLNYYLKSPKSVIETDPFSSRVTRQNYSNDIIDVDSNDEYDDYVVDETATVVRKKISFSSSSSSTSSTSSSSSTISFTLEDKYTTTNSTTSQYHSQNTHTHKQQQQQQQQRRQQRQKEIEAKSMLLEYKNLSENSPRGIYVLPSMLSNHNTLFHGVIFIRRGLYKNAIFKFSIEMFYSEREDSSLLGYRYPEVTFYSEVFHPYVNIDTGKLDLSIEFPSWGCCSDSESDNNERKKKCNLTFLVLYIKKIFYLTKFKDPSSSSSLSLCDTLQTTTTTTTRGGNYNAYLLSEVDYNIGFKQKVYTCVDNSQRHVKDCPNSSMKFSAQDEERYQMFRYLLLNEKKKKNEDEDEDDDKEKGEKSFFDWNDCWNTTSFTTINTNSSSSSSDSNEEEEEQNNNNTTTTTSISREEKFTSDEILQMVQDIETKLYLEEEQSTFGCSFYQ